MIVAGGEYVKLVEGPRAGRASSRGQICFDVAPRIYPVRSFLKYAARHDLTALKVIERALAVPMKRFGRPMLGFLSGQEMQAILHVSDSTTWVGQRDGALFTMLYNTGARASEIIGLRIKDVVLDTSPSAHIMGKGRKQRSVPLWQLTVRMMRT